MKNKLTQEHLKEVLYYDQYTGIFTWRVNHSGGAGVGESAGGLNLGDGYIYIQVDGIRCPAHRLAFLYMIGQFPENQIDHINRRKHDNKWINLREVSFTCNVKNRGLFCNNTSSVVGVNWYKSSNRWAVYIRVNKKLKHLSRHKDFDEAVCTRLAAEQCLVWQNCDSCRSTTAYDYVERLMGRKLRTPEWRKIRNQNLSRNV